jgi:uroporphyrin-III C-methyltransferase/precorrin-2 dehydrogenase/sirohydrochlorin ferrochelatase
MHSFPVFLRLRARAVILLGEGEGADAKRRLLLRAGAIPSPEHANAAFAIVAIEDEAEAQAAIARLKERGILVNAVDRPALCDVTLPAIVDRDPLLIAIGTGGASAGLAKALRQRLEAWLPAGVGTLADRLHAARDAIRARWPAPDARRRAIDAGLAPGGPIDPLGEPDLDRWLAATGTEAPARRETVPIRSGDPDELTLRAARLLGAADRVHHPADMPAAILDRARADAVRIAGVPAPDRPGPGLTLDLVWAR